MKTIKVTFSANFVPSFDTLYTYKTSANVQPDQLLWVDTREGFKQVRVISIDAVYDKEAEKKYGPLAEAFADKPSTQPELPLRSRL